jgi:hypothetical protein
MKNDCWKSRDPMETTTAQLGLEMDYEFVDVVF